MSDTPRTDGSIISIPNNLFPAHPIEVISVEFSRQLERELDAVTAERDALREDKARLDKIQNGGEQ